jgi:hypothetical protein
VPALIGRHGSFEGRRFDIDGELCIGREDQEVTVDDPGVSRRHALLRVDGDVVTIEDLGSLNGTFVNGTRLEGAVPLANGDVIELGSTSFSYEGPAARSAATVATPVPRVEAPEAPFGAYASGDVAGSSRGKVASRQLVPELISIVAVICTAAALVLYFALR